MEGKTVLISRQEGIATITLNRPDQYNALSTELLQDLWEALDAFRSAREARVCILNGAGRNFSSGADLKQYANRQAPDDMERRATLSTDIHTMFSKIEKPIVGSVRGYALAGGCGLAMGCDMVIASENAVFGYPEVRRGIIPAIVMANLTKLVGRRRALEYVMTGRRISAAEALAVGMVNQVVADEKLEQRTLEFARDLTALNSSSLATIKRLFYQVAEQPLDAGIRAGSEVNVAMRQTREFFEGVLAFKQIPNRQTESEK